MPNFDLAHWGGERQISESQLETLRHIASLTECEFPYFAEVGSWTGRSTAVLAKYVKERKGGLYAVDWFLGNPGTRLAELIKAGVNVKNIFEANMRELGVWDVIHLIETTGTEASQQIRKETLDLVFLDADHRYHEVLEDLNMWYPKIRNGGIFCGHDCEMTLEEAENQKKLTPHFKDVDYENGIHPGVIAAVFKRFKNVHIENGIWWTVKNKERDGE